MYERIRQSNYAFSTYLIATALCSLSLVIQFRLWRSDFHVPFYYDVGHDNDFQTAVVKTLADAGWVLTNPWLGAPGVQENHDIWQGDSLQWALIKFVGEVTPDFGTAINLSFLLGFVLTTWTSLFVLRRLGMCNPIAVVVSLLYAFQPYHFARNEHHLALSFYFAVPLIVLVMVWLCEGQPIFSNRDELGRLRPKWCRGKTATALFACLLIGSSGAYYAFFAAALVGVAGLVGLSRSWKIVRLSDPAIVLGLICGFFAVNIAPHLWYVRQAGKNPVVAVRNVDDSSQLALTLVDLTKPVPYHPLKGLVAALRGRERPLPTARECIQVFHLHEKAPLGLAATCGFLALLLTLFLSRRPKEDLKILASLSRLNLGSILFVSNGGLGLLFALWVSAKIRGWNRISIFIAFFSLVALAVLLEHVRRHWIKTSRAWFLFHGVLAGILVFGIFEQFSQTWLPDHTTAKAEFEYDREIVRKIEGRLPENALVFQLPYVPFPEGHSSHHEEWWKFLSYVHLRPYLHSSRVHWSGGAMKGRAVARWQESVSDQPASKLVPELRARGFRGLWIDRRGYGDGADVKLIADLRELLGVAPVIDERGYIVFFVLPEGTRELGIVRGN
jgi:phosphoglycerol transferase